MSSVGLDCSALDPSFKEHAQRGIGRYVRELSAYFSAHEAEDVSVGRFDHRNLRGGLVDTLVEYAPAGKTTIRQQLIYPLRLSGRRLEHFDVLHFPAHMDAPAWTLKPYVLTVLDLIPLVLADLYKADRPTWRFTFARWLEIRAIKNASLILAISENTARDVSRTLNVPRERIVVTPLGVDEKFLRAFRPSKQRDLDLLHRLGISSQRQVVLYVGGIDQRKNMGLLLDVAHEIKRRYLEQNRAAPVVLCVGKISQDRQYPALLKRRDELGLQEDVVLAGYVDEPSLLSLYSACDAFLFPSLYEGFGLPVLEAMAAGLPVVSSNASSIPEVIGDDGLTFDPSNVREAVNKLYDVLNNDTLATEYRHRAHRRATKFSWEKTGASTLEAYRSILERLGHSTENAQCVQPLDKVSQQPDLYGPRRDVAF